MIADPEFVQFHPTAMDVGIDPAPLATEALRGDGATLINGQGERFMLAHHADAELAPRDIVARGVFTEIAEGRGAFLDCREAIGARFATSYPTVYAHCVRAGIDPAKELIPIAPAAHYHMGGVASDLHGRTSVEGLWVAGEVAATGLHGANRLASNSLLEAVVFGGRVAEDVAKLVDKSSATPIAELKRIKGRKVASRAARNTAVALLRETMANDVGVVRNAAGLKRALSTLQAISEEHGSDGLIANMALTARLIAAAALARKESRGGHYRRDYPHAVPALASRTFMTLDDLQAIESAARRTRPAIKTELTCAL